MAEPIAAATEPPDEITLTTANCDAPVNTSSDMAMAFARPKPDPVARAPKATPTTPTARPMLTPSRTAESFRSGWSAMLSLDSSLDTSVEARHHP